MATAMATLTPMAMVTLMTNCNVDGAICNSAKSTAANSKHEITTMC